MKYFKNINKIVLFILSVMVFYSCTKNLDYKVYDQISPDNFPKTKEDVQVAVTGIYHVLSDGWTPEYMDNSHFILTELPTDELTTAWSNSWQEENEFLWLPNSTDVTNIYTFYQRGITRATLLLDQLNNLTLTDTSYLNRSIAEVRALRAIFAFYLYDLYGTVPIVTDPAIANDVTKNSTPARPTQTDMVSFLTTELTAAAGQLPLNYPDNGDYGHLTKGAALSFLLKLFMHEKDWTKADQASAEIMDLNQYQLLNNYNDVFDIKNENVDNKEIIMVIPRLATPGNLAHTWFAAVMPPVPQYRSQNIKAIWGGLKTPWPFYDKFDSTDQRLERMIRYYYDVNGDYVDYRKVDHVKAVGACPMKFSEDPNQQGAAQGNDFIIFRYAAVLLYRAEALNHINNGPTEESISLINMVRERAGIAPVTGAGFTGMDDFDNFILDEEGRELWCEGYRRDDLIRHGKYISDATHEGYTSAKPFMVLYPIPQSVLNENPNITQNEGY